MNSLQGLYKTKLALLATVSTIVGIALLMLTHGLSPRPGWAWSNGVINDLGGAFFTTGLIAIFFQYINEKDSDQRADDRLRRVLAQEAPAIRDAVVNGFAFAPASLTKVASPDTLDRIIENCLAIQFGDHELAQDAYHELGRQVVQTKPRRHDARVSVTLSPWEDGPSAGTGAMFVATIKWEYRLVPQSPVVRLSCVSDLDEYRELLDDPSSIVTWYFEPIGELDGSSPDVFKLLQFAVDGKPVRARRISKTKMQVLMVDIGEAAVAAGRAVTLSYSYRALVQQHGHLLYLDILQPTKGLHAQFWYGDCGIRHVSILDYIAGAGQPRIARLPASDPTPSVEVSFDGWVFPKAGLAFVWVLERELASST